MEAKNESDQTSSSSSVRVLREESFKMMVQCPCDGMGSLGSQKVGGEGKDEDVTPTLEVTPDDLCFQVKNQEDGDQGQGRQMDFVIFPTYRGVEDKVDGILDHGGTVREFSEEDYQRQPCPDYSIILINFKEICYNRAHSNLLLPNDAYDVQFIKDFIGNPAETDLRQYKITPTNHKLKGQNVNDILFQRRSWNSLVRLRKPPPRVNNANLLKLFHAIQNNYDSCSSVESEGSRSPCQIPEQKRSGWVGLENKESPPPAKIWLRSSSTKRKKAAQDDEFTSKNIGVVSGPLAPQTENHEGNNKTSGWVEEIKRLEFYSQEFIPPKDQKNRVIRNGRRNNVVAPINTWLGRDDDGNRVLSLASLAAPMMRPKPKPEKTNGPGPFSSHLRRFSHRKSNIAGPIDQDQSQPIIADHSRTRARADDYEPDQDSSSKDDDFVEGCPSQQGSVRLSTGTNKGGRRRGTH